MKTKHLLEHTLSQASSAFILKQMHNVVINKYKMHLKSFGFSPDQILVTESQILFFGGFCCNLLFLINNFV